VKKNVQVRLDQDDFDRVLRLVEISKISESEIMRQCVRAGLTRIERGEVNPFTDEKKPIGREDSTLSTATRSGYPIAATPADRIILNENPQTPQPSRKK
jgi:hypothetical protein